MTKVLVTGGSGFIGSNFIRYTLKKHSDWQITNLDKLTYAGNPANLKDIEAHPELSKRYKFMQGDICSADDVKKAMQGAELVFHFAAESHVDVSIVDPYIFTRSNVLGTHIMLETARNTPTLKKFIHISTDEVYGSIKEGSFTEKSPFKPSSAYSASKAGADLTALAYFTTYRLPVIVTRSSNNFGPYQYPEKVMPLFITNLFEGKKVPVYGNGKNVRDWIFVEDNCAGIDFAAEKGKIGEAYNVGGGNEIPNIEITKKIIAATGRDESFIEFVQDRLGHDLRYSLDCSKIKTLGWKPTHKFEAALTETVKWYKENKQWWTPLKKKLIEKGQIK